VKKDNTVSKRYKKESIKYCDRLNKKPSYPCTKPCNVTTLAPTCADRSFPQGEKNLSNKRSIGKLEAKKARNYVHQHLTSRHRNNNPDEIKETIFTGSTDEMRSYVLSEVGESRTGEIPDYPQGLVCFDSCKRGYFNLVKLEDEVPLF